MKRLLTVAALALLSTTALAENNSVLIKSGYWEVRHIAKNSNGSEACVMSSEWTFPRGVTGLAMLKYDANKDAAFWHLYKSSWHFTKEMKVPLTMTLDAGNRDAIGTTMKGNQFLEIGINADAVVSLLDDFANSDTLRFVFKTGNELPWVANMTGSHAASRSFIKCVTDVIDKRPQATSPDATSPVAPNASSPVGVTPSNGKGAI